jgi:anti-sigma regulatory factor (Ser/Thr protein kinase)
MPEHRLPHSATSVVRARRLAEEAAASRVPPAQKNDFVLMVSEAVSNAVLHARPMADGRIGLSFENHDGALRGMVTDGGSRSSASGGASWSAAEAERAAGAGARVHHYGLSIIKTLSSRWGVTVDGVTNVWFEVNAPDPTTAADPSPGRSP